MALDLATAQANLDAWIAADLALAGGMEEYTVDVAGNKTTIKKSDAAMVGERITYWNRWCLRLGRTNGIRAREVIPR